MHRLILAVAALGLIMLAAAGPASAGGGEVQETKWRARHSHGAAANERKQSLLDAAKLLGVSDAV